MKVVIAQITQAMGFNGISQSACECLADILQLCMHFNELHTNIILESCIDLNWFVMQILKR